MVHSLLVLALAGMLSLGLTSCGMGNDNAAQNGTNDTGASTNGTYDDGAESSRADPIEGSYVFEVSSAGADRVLKTPAHYEQFMGTEVEVKLYRPREGRKEFVGLLKSYDNGNVSIDINGQSAEFTKQEIALVRLYPRF